MNVNGTKNLNVKMLKQIHTHVYVCTFSNVDGYEQFMHLLFGCDFILQTLLCSRQMSHWDHNGYLICVLSCILCVYC